MEFKDTVNGMLSKDYKERFQAEYQQLKIRTEKLKRMLCDWCKQSIDFEPDAPAEILFDQLTVMEQYLNLLQARARIEGIEI